jgi:ABC-type Fe3+/spermidine/putrescine transport system ATPase subunit
MAPPFLRLDGLSKRFGATLAVADLSLTVTRGEAVTLLGPSGCGKTTILRMIAGLETPDSGAIAIGGDTVFSRASRLNLPPEKRKIGMVFQNYAIWPHLTVGENVGFPLRVRRLPRAIVRIRVGQALAMVGLEGLEDRPATRLSGGQQQRVALARGLIHEPALLLLDEPLSNLDAKLREQMRLELKLLQQRLDLTLLYVTHDQNEALALSDRILLLKAGRVEQIGGPRELYEQPRTPFVRDFLGKSVLLRGEILASAAQSVTVRLAGSETVIACAAASGHGLAPGAAIEIAIRPEAIRLADREDGEGTLVGSVEAVLYQGERSECEVRVGGQSMLAYVPPERRVARGDRVALAIAPESISLWPL